MKKHAGKQTRLVVLGSTGSVGSRALDVASDHPGRFKVEGMSANRNWKLFLKQVQQFKPRRVAVTGEAAAKHVEPICKKLNIKLFSGETSLEKLAAGGSADAVFVGVVGLAGLAPTLAALEKGRKVMTANKESLAAAGGIIAETSRKSRSNIIPVDSEHSAIYQALQGRSMSEVERVILTASGGPFLKRKNLRDVTPREALAHPRWKMGKKTTVDSATLMNKGLELIEAATLFSLSPEKIGIVIHPESVVHCLVELLDGTTVAHAAIPDMKIPVQYAMSCPERLPVRDTAAMPVSRLEKLTFSEPDEKKFPCLPLARSALEAGGTAPAVLSAADEAAVAAFLLGRIRFTDIHTVVAGSLERCATGGTTLEEILEADSAARRAAAAVIRELS